MESIKTERVDNLIIGSGIAGLALALELAKKQKVLVITKAAIEDNNTWYAQGGIASVLAPWDTFQHHYEDTVRAGAGLCHPGVVREVVESAPDAINELISLGVDFTKFEEQQARYPYHLSKEGGHSKRRVIHAGDLTGREVLLTLISAAQQNDNIELREHYFAIDLLTTDRFRPSFSGNSCFGASFLDRDRDSVHHILAERTYLCTGGHGKVYLYTSNPDNATGDGLAMGWRAGSKVANLEFTQFHPTCLYHPKAKNFLISEALRGEGAVLINQEGIEFAKNHHEMGSLAPRDIVARCIDSELKQSGADCVFLDARRIGKERLMSLFPNIYKRCGEFGLQIDLDPIPVVPAAHYSCGGLPVDAWGRTSIDNLFAIGETACTGLHGANRLASNSLTEALVFARKAARYAQSDNSRPFNFDDIVFPTPQHEPSVPSDERVVLSQTWEEIRRLMWNYVGIVRSQNRLTRALDRVVAIRREIDIYYRNYSLCDDLLEVRNIADVAYLTIRCALLRRESRGIHYTLDNPEPDPVDPIDTIIW